MSEPQPHENNAANDEQPADTSQENGTGNSMQPFMPSLLDREIRSSSADAFGHEHFAKALESLIETEAHRPPYSVGLLGRWGTGKSSIKSLYLEGLSQSRIKDARGLVRSEKVHVVTFNAWRFGGENIRRALLRHVYMDIGGDESVIMDTLFNQVQKPTMVPKSWKDIWREIYDKWLWILVQVLAVAAALICLTAIAARVLSLEEEWAITSVLGIQSLLVGILLKYLLDAKRFAISRFATINRMELPTVSAEQFEKLLVDQIIQFKKGHGKCERLVVFVDDLDRLSAEEMVSGLDAIRTFMEIPNEDRRLADIGIVFVISCDEDRVADALANKRKDPRSDLPGVIFTRTDARRYLDRIFQFRLEIPPFPRQDMRAFAQEKLQTELPHIAQGIRDRGASVEEVVSRMIHVGVQSPRNALHIINAFVESWWVAERREREGAGTDKRGALSGGAVTKHPLALAALCALRVDFPDFYNDLQNEPDLIPRFLDVFAYSKPLASQPERVRFVLEKYASPLSDGDAEDSPRKLKEGWRPLRQYLTGVASIPWPNSLQPLLLLSQDPVSRRIGDGGQRIYEAFVSGDAQGVLADLGRDKDELKLDSTQVRWLRDMIEQIETETDDYRDNANAVLVELSNRYPQGEAGHLLIPVARRLDSSKRLRSRVGVDKVPPILPLIPPSDRRNVTGRFVEDFLLPSGDIAFTLPSGETPSLEEGVSMCRTVVDFSLSVRKEVGLETKNDSQLLDWLLRRNLEVAGKSFQFSFTDLEGWMEEMVFMLLHPPFQIREAELEGWMEEHEDHLLGSMGSSYLTVAADALADKKNYEDFDLAPTAQRIERLLNSLWDSGQESRQTAFDLAGRLVHVDPTGVNMVAQTFFRTHGASADAATASLFIQNAAERVHKFLGEGDMDEADSDAVNLLVSTSSARQDLAETAMGKVGDVAIKLSRFDNKAQSAVDVTNSLVTSYPAEAKRVISSWAPRAMADLPDRCLELMSRHYEDILDDYARTTLIDGMTSVAQSSAPTEDQARRYRLAMSALPSAAFQEEPLLSHITATLHTISQEYSSIGYLQGIFPVVPRILEYGPKPYIGSMLHALLSQTTGYPTVHPFLHEVMRGNWPTAETALSPYSPDNAFNWALSFVQANPSLQGSAAVLLSMESMAQSGIVSDGMEETLIETAASIWRYHHQEANEVLKRSKLFLSPEEIAGLSSPVPQDSEALDSLREIWNHYAENITQNQQVEVIRELLDVPSEPFGGLPDGRLRLWCEPFASQTAEFFERFANDNALNSEQKLRAWKQFESNLDVHSKDTIVSALERALLSDEATAKAALDAADQIGKHFNTTDEKHLLAKRLIEIFPKALNLDSKNCIAQWVKTIGNAGVLKHVDKNSYSQEDIGILLSQFPSSNRLKNLLDNQNE